MKKKLLKKIWSPFYDIHRYVCLEDNDGYRKGDEFEEYHKRPLIPNEILLTQNDIEMLDRIGGGDNEGC